MSRYFYQIVKTKTGFRFVLYPSNNNNQSVGESCEFPSELAAKESLYQFQQFVKENRESLSKYTEIIEKETVNDGLYYYGTLNYKNGSFFREKGYKRKSEYTNWFKRIEKNIDAKTKDS